MQFPNFAVRWWYKLRRRVRSHPIAYGVGCLLAVLFIYFALFSAPFDFPVGAYISIPSGQTVGETARVLKERHIIWSSDMFDAFVRVFGTDRQVVAGEYFFPNKEGVLHVASRLGNGDFQVNPSRVRVPEGATVQDIGALLDKSIPNFDLNAFMKAARGKEGYLFPDTYFFMPGQDTDAILGAFANNFATHIATIQHQLDAFGHPFSDVITMASLLEREAPDSYNRRIIAGILWKRISLGMPLQVDAVFPYIIGKSSLNLTYADLATLSPYNTYINLGLPPGPIGNPSLDSILAAVTPIETNYLYYLSDTNGAFHYSATYGQQLAAKSKYLNN